MPMSDHDDVSAADDVPGALISVIDSLMWRILKGHEDPVELVAEVSGEFLQPSWAEVAHAGGLYRLFAELGDIVDGWPVSYGEATEMVAQREIRDAAWDWLETVRTAGAMESFLERWEARGGE